MLRRVRVEGRLVHQEVDHRSRRQDEPVPLGELVPGRRDGGHPGVLARHEHGWLRCRHAELLQEGEQLGAVPARPRPLRTPSSWPRSDRHRRPRRPPGSHATRGSAGLQPLHRVEAQDHGGRDARRQPSGRSGGAHRRRASAERSTRPAVAPSTVSPLPFALPICSSRPGVPRGVTPSPDGATRRPPAPPVTALGGQVTSQRHDSASLEVVRVDRRRPHDWVESPRMGTTYLAVVPG